MKKNRNNFFPEYGYNSTYPGMNPGYMPGAQIPGAQTPGGMNSNANFYASTPTVNPMMTPNPGNNMGTDLDSRLSKLERQINRLETRVSKLEGETGATYPENNDYNYPNNMYMV